MKNIIRIIIVVIIAVVAMIIGVALPYKWNGEVGEEALFPFDEHAWDRAFDIINAMLLFVTLLTAIFKEQILANLYHAKFEIDKNNDYSEMVEHTETGSRANSYEKTMVVQNVGNRPATNCRLVIEKVSVKCESDYHETEVDFNETIILPQCTSPSNNQLRPSGALSFSVFRILPKVVAHDDIPERPMLFQIGDNKIDIKQGKTDYTIAFHIESEDMQSPTNKIVVRWNGKWPNRKTEMAKVLSVEYLS